MTMTDANVSRVAPFVYTGGSLTAAAAFFLAALIGDYDWVARLGGAGWVFALMMTILMPTVPALLLARATGRPVEFSHDHEAMLRGEAPAAKVKDPVCGMEIDPAAAAGTSTHMGSAYYFCNLNCKASFDGDPSKYVAGMDNHAE